MADDSSLTIEETNALRAKLGLPPLKMGAPKSAATETLVRPVAPAPRPANQPLVPTKFQRQLLATKGLAEDDEDEGDLSSWVVRNRELEGKKKAEEERRRAQAELEARRKRKRAEMGDEDAVDPGYSARDLAGIKVKQSADDLDVGETVVLTLEDRAILGENGELDEGEDELINAVQAEERKRRKARAAAKKQGAVPDYDALHGAEDAEKADAEVALVIDEEGRIAAEEKRREAVRSKLMDRSAALLSEGALPGSDYMTKEEAEARFAKGKKEKKRKLRQKGPSLLEELEQIVGEGGESDLGSRAQRAERQRQMADAEAAEKQQKAANFDRALAKANYASLALKISSLAAAEQVTVGEEDEEPELVHRIGKAVGTTGRGLEAMAKRIIESRAEAVPAGASAGLVFSNATEFVRGIEAADRPRASEAAPSSAAAPRADDADAAMAEGGGEVDEHGATDAAAMDVDEETPSRAPTRTGAADGGRPPGSMPPPPPPAPVNRGLGLGSILGSLRDTGELKRKVEWHGRNTDMKMNPHNEEAVKPLYDRDDETGQRVEAALRKVDQFGRTLTPKEAFRQMCHTFHGKAPSKLRQEKAIKKYAQELTAKKQLTASNAASGVAKVTEVQAKLHTPYLVLEGTLTAGQVADPTSAYATRERAGGDAFPVHVPGTASTAPGTASVKPGGRPQFHSVGPSFPPRQPPPGPGAAAGHGTASVAPSVRK